MNQKKKEEILKFIVKDFIKTAEPVASKTLVSKNKLNYSSSAIRTEMNKLEKEGFLKKIHNSSGRIPLKKAYEHYLNDIQINNDNVIDKNFKKNLKEIIDKKILSVSNVINDSCKILAEMTNLAVISSGRENIKEYLEKIMLFPISNNSATAFFLTNKGYSESKTFIFSDGINPEDVSNFIEIFNKYLKGTLISEIISKIESMKSVLLTQGKSIIYKAIFEMFLNFTRKHYEFYGKDKLFKQPEFKNNIEKLKKILEIFDDPKKIESEVSKITTNKKIGGVDVYISDNKKDNVSVLSIPIYFENEISSKIYLVGPPRMDYDKGINLLNYLKNTIDEYFKNLGGCRKCLIENQKKKKTKEEKNYNKKN